ncbi:hypothetical protein [Coleofasciculus sp. B1-GNL1-01]|uniref:hypothetical protein n=1 Tax=Coleofasciculus sp. B1-GNL1-01 TaxID=3068484 RepID=UPI0040644930
MHIHWKKLVFTTTLWLVTEIILNLLGLDNLADYSEFVFGRNGNLGQSLNSALMILIR